VLWCLVQGGWGESKTKSCKHQLPKLKLAQIWHKADAKHAYPCSTNKRFSGSSTVLPIWFAIHFDRVRSENVWPWIYQSRGKPSVECAVRIDLWLDSARQRRGVSLVVLSSDCWWILKYIGFVKATPTTRVIRFLGRCFDGHGQVTSSSLLPTLTLTHALEKEKKGKKIKKKKKKKKKKKTFTFRIHKSTRDLDLSRQVASLVAFNWSK
jgi:hypothetical protein